MCIHAPLSYNSFTIYAPASPLFNSLQLLAECVHMMGTGEIDMGIDAQARGMYVPCGNSVFPAKLGRTWRGYVLFLLAQSDSL